MGIELVSAGRFCEYAQLVVKDEFTKQLYDCQWEMDTREFTGLIASLVETYEKKCHDEVWAYDTDKGRITLRWKRKHYAEVTRILQDCLSNYWQKVEIDRRELNARARKHAEAFRRKEEAKKEA